MTKEILQIGVPDHNGHIFTKEAVQKMLDDIAEINPLLGELGHVSESSVSLKNVSHEIKNVRIAGNHLVCEVTILDTPAGSLVSKIDPSDFRLEPRCIGYPNMNGEVTITKMVSIDIVTGPGSSLEKTLGHKLYKKYVEGTVSLEDFKNEHRGELKGHEFGF